VREQLRERDISARGAERGLKEAILERAAADRRFEVLQGDFARVSERFAEVQSAYVELEARSDMLAKALAAKDVALEQAALRTTTLTGRIEDLTVRFEKERREAEDANRRLTEDLENERSERVMAVGALEIARESRIALQRHNEALKRAARVLRTPDLPEVGDMEHGTIGERAEAAAEQPSNIRPFLAPERPT
jgi:crescentin